MINSFGQFWTYQHEAYCPDLVAAAANDILHSIAQPRSPGLGPYYSLERDPTYKTYTLRSPRNGPIFRTTSTSHNRYDPVPNVRELVSSVGERHGKAVSSTWINVLQPGWSVPTHTDILPHDTVVIGLTGRAITSIALPQSCAQTLGHAYMMGPGDELYIVNPENEQDQPPHGSLHVSGDPRLSLVCQFAYN